MSATFSSLWGRVKSARILGGTDSSSPLQRQNTVATTTSSPPPPPSLASQRRATITDSQTVADALNSGDADQIGGIMKKHMVRVAKTSSVKQGNQTFGVRKAFGSPGTRRDSKGDLRELLTFELFRSDNMGDAPTVQASYFPMTDQAEAWAGTPGDQTLQKGNVEYTRHRRQLAVTSPLSGCSVLERGNGELAHVQPFGTATGNSTDLAEIRATTQKATQQLEDDPRNVDVYGPEEYGNYTDHGALKRTMTNVMVMKDPDGNKKVLSQTLYGNKSQAADIVMKQRDFGPQIPPSGPLNISITPPPVTTSTPPPASNRSSHANSHPATSVSSATTNTGAKKTSLAVPPTSTTLMDHRW